MNLFVHLRIHSELLLSSYRTKRDDDVKKKSPFSEGNTNINSVSK